MANKTFIFNANVINGEFYQFSQTVVMPCNGSVLPLGVEVFRGFDSEGNTVAKRVYVVQYKGSYFGTNDFKSREDYYSFLNSVCATCPAPYCYLTINGCIVNVNGCELLYKKNF